MYKSFGWAGNGSLSGGASENDEECKLELYIPLGRVLPGAAAGMCPITCADGGTPT